MPPASSSASGCVGAQRQEFVERARREEGAVERGGRRSRRRRAAGAGSTGRPAILRHRLDDRPVAGAAAEIAGQRIVDRLEVGRLAAGGKGIGRHDEARRAEAALRGIGSRPSRVCTGCGAAVGAAQALDRAHRLAVDLAQQRDAGIDRLAAAVALQHDGAGAAIALGAAFLGAASGRDARAASRAGSSSARRRRSRPARR